MRRRLGGQDRIRGDANYDDDRLVTMCCLLINLDSVRVNEGGSRGSINSPPHDSHGLADQKKFIAKGKVSQSQRSPSPPLRRRF